MKSSRDETSALLSLFFAPGVGAVTGRRLLERFGSARQALESVDQWRSEKGLLGLFNSLEDPSFQQKVDKEAEWLHKNQGRVISIYHPEYPPLLKNTHQAPPILFFKGSFSSWDGKVPIAFVGTRTPSDYGRKVVEMLLEGFAHLPVVIVSGFASGIDTFAHEFALKFGLETVGVLGTGLDTVYPPENRELFRRMSQKGAFLTQFPTGVEPLPWHFPERNRIIAGSARATVVIEAREKSGALITGQIALEEGREVMAVPGSILSMKNRGGHYLIQQGAKLVQSVPDILVELKLPVPGETQQKTKGDVEKISQGSEEDLLFQKISEEPQHIDKITEISNLPASSVAGALTTLTLKGLIEELPGKFYVRS